MKRDWSKARPVRVSTGAKRKRPGRASAPTEIVVSPRWDNRSRGTLTFGATTVRCALGRGGVATNKREGDGATPFGRYEIVARLIRRDRLPAPATTPPMEAIRAGDGWCDDAKSGAYNRPIPLPSRLGHEEMWRDDGLYDVVLVLDHNLRRRTRSRGSAIFFHVATIGYEPTAGCVAISIADMRRLLPRLPRRAFLRILLPGGGARSKNRRADAHMGRARLDRQLEIRAHSHRQ